MNKDYTKLTKQELNKEFLNACYDEDVDLVKYLLTSEELRIKANINTNKDWGFLFACQKGNVIIVDYLLTSKKLIKNIELNKKNSYGLIYACQNRNLDLIKYFLTSKKIKNLDIHMEKDKGFKFVCENNYEEVARFLIFDINIEETKYIKKYIKTNKCEKIECMFRLRDLKK